MFGFLRVVLWSAACIGLGIFLSTAKFDGRTPIEHARRSIAGAPSAGSVWDGAKDKLDDAKDKASDLSEKVSDKVSDKIGSRSAGADPVAVKEGPKEKHTAADRAALDKILAKGGSR